MELLITGLCFSGNLGGPALALSLKKGIAERIDNAEFTFAVPHEEAEASLARHYDCRIIRNVDRRMIRRLKYPRLVNQAVHLATGKGGQFVRDYDRMKIDLKRWNAAWRECSAVLNLAGISFVGDGMRSARWARTELFAFLQARRHRKPYARFIQSYGPFDDEEVAGYARQELSTLDHIYARGESTARKCRELLGDGSPVADYPDCAIVLPAASDAWRDEFLGELRLRPGSYLVVSPSAVIAGSSASGSKAVGENYVEAVAQMVGHFANEGHEVLLLPHACYPETLERCDGEVCRAVRERCALSDENEKRVHVVEAPLDALQAKALIGGASLAIVSRYHAAVAALSTATPVVAIGWNIKYRDILEYYGLRDLALDAREFAVGELVKEVLERCRWWGSGLEEKRREMRGAQVKNEERVGEAFDLLCGWLVRTVGGAVKDDH